MHKNLGFSLDFKSEGYSYWMYIKSRVCPAYIFIDDCLSPFLFGIIFSRTTLTEVIFEIKGMQGNLDMFWLGGGKAIYNPGQNI